MRLTGTCAIVLGALMVVVCPTQPASAAPAAECVSVGAGVQLGVGFSCEAGSPGVLPGGGAVAVACAPGAEECLYTGCDVWIDDDSLYPNGIVWDRSNPYLFPSIAGPSPAGISAGDYERLDTLSPEARGVFAESGTWLQCYLLDAVVPEGERRVWARSMWWVPLGGHVIDPWALLEVAYGKALPPDPEIVHAPPERAIAKAPTWFWVPPGYWHQYDGEGSSRSGRLSVRVQAEPLGANWDTGEVVLACDGPGTVWEASLDPRRDSDCWYEYQDETSVYGRPHDVGVAVEFEVTWEMDFSNGRFYDRGSLGVYVASSSAPLEVGSIQALVVDYPGATDDYGSGD